MFEPAGPKTASAVLVFQDQEEDSLGSPRLCSDNYRPRSLLGLLESQQSGLVNELQEPMSLNCMAVIGVVAISE